MAEAERIIYPPGVRDLSEDISTDDLVRRLKDCAQAFQNMSQDDDNASYVPLALYLASDTFLEHRSRDVRLLVACCIADVFRIYAPEAPYREPTQLKAVFEFLIDQLKGLKDPKDPSFKRYFYLLENFSCVHTFNLCVELEDNQKIMCHLFKLMFKIINEGHTTKVKRFMLDTLSPVIGEADIISQEFLDIILSQIIEPIKSQNKDACALAQDILKRNVATLEPYVQAFFNNALLLGKTLESSLAQHLYELMYELNVICPTMLVVVLPQLEFKLKSNEESERRDVIKVLTRMFSDKNSTMIEQHETLWNCLLSRFSDISPQIRILCVQQVKNFLLNHPESKKDITEQLRHRYRDTDENVRYEVVVAIISAAKEDLNCVNEEMLSFVKERTLDKKFKIRKEALLGLSLICKQLVSVFSEVSKEDSKFILWVRKKVLHVYYQTSLEDKLLVERIFHSCLVPYSKPFEERMKILYQLYCTVDDNAVKAFRELLKCQSSLRNQVRSLIDFNIKDKSENKKKVIASKILLLAKHFLDPSKANEYLSKFFNELETNMRLTSMMTEILGGNLSCSEADYKVKEVLKVLGHPVQTNSYYVIIKQLFERIAPVMIDKQGIKHLISFIKDSLLGDGAIDAELHLESSAHRGLELLIVLTYVFPTAFKDSQIYNSLLQFLSADDPHAVDLTLQIFLNISTNLELNFPDIYEALLPMLLKFVETGTAKQAKHAVHCIHQIVQDKEEMFGNLIEVCSIRILYKVLKKHMSFASKHFRTALVSFGHIAYLCHDMFASEFKAIAAQVVVKNLLMLDQATPRDKDETWAPFESLPEETKCKIEGMKVMVRWLTGLKDMVQPSKSTLVLFSTIILNNGDLMERDHNSFLENAWMRLSAACCMLKLCQEPSYIKVISVEQFQILAYVMQDDLPEIRVRFASKIHKGLLSMKLGLHFLAILSLCGLDSSKEFKNQVKEYIAINVQKRREYIKQRVITGEKLVGFLPDYALPFAIHLLAHAPFFKVYNDVPSLLKIKECLWVLMEPLILKNDNYSFSFFKRLLENIKQTKDKQDPNDQETNMRLYAVCDLALNLIMSKTSNFVLKDFPAEPVLPAKFFTEMDRNYSNLKTYLPPELICTKPSDDYHCLVLTSFIIPG
ncbi:sister chromatid cohesion protein PDS5 homolog B-like [Uloborus diversus]|uniref:sister chromatid cohesion protein PDS5 homolog B-like n=1 Tax=Uloborus diversus TaxID=327109 RepID=UPI0024095276|nr:sister chromatid cohesion protein PDS5 homolog B-like [Uloborus diversus]